MPNASFQTALNQARALHGAGQLQQAEAIYRQILAHDPKHDEALHLLGVLLHQLGQRPAALQYIAAAIALRPDVPNYHGNYAEIQRRGGQLDEAERACRRAIELEPKAAIHHVRLCSILRDRRQLSAAVAAGKIAVNLDPQSPGAWRNLANALSDGNEFDSAIDCYRRALAIDPDAPETLTCLGTTLAECGRLDEAIEFYDRAIQTKDWPDAHYSRGLLLLLRGNFHRGWPEFEWRWRSPNFHSVRFSTDRPLWDGAQLRNDQTLLLFAEQGLGDTIQFIRYAAMVRPRVGKLILHCHPELRSLLKCIGEIDQITTYNEPLPQSDFLIPLLSLPRLFNTDLSNPPAPIPYLKADPEKTEHWRRHLGKSEQPRIGLAWAGNAKHTNDRNRSIDLSQLSQLAEATNAKWISLQKGATAATHETSAALQLFDWTDRLHDFSDTAALIDNLDLVITVDTSVAHLAGAMGKQVWVLLPFVPDWRWMLERADSPWYPTMKLFRQPKAGDWRTAIDQVAQNLRKLVSLGVQT